MIASRLLVFASVWISAACSSPTPPVEPVTLDSIAGRYTLTRVGGKALPVTLGACFIAGCASVGTVVSGTFEIGSEIPGQWKATINEIDETTGGARSRVYEGAGTTMTSPPEIVFSVANATDPLFATWSGRVSGNALFVTINVFDYEFRKTSR